MIHRGTGKASDILISDPGKARVWDMPCYTILAFHFGLSLLTCDGVLAGQILNILDTLYVLF